MLKVHKTILNIFLYLILIFIITINYALSTETVGDNENLNYINDISFINQDGTINAVVEIEAGSIEKWEVNKKGDKLIHTFKDNQKKLIDYLPYPYNYGFIPQTLVPLNEGDDGDPLDIIIIGPTIKKGSIIKVKVIGTMIMGDNTELDSKVIALAINNLKLSESKSIKDLEKNYIGLMDIIKIWTINHKKTVLKLDDILNKKNTMSYIIKHNKYYKEKK